MICDRCGATVAAVLIADDGEFCSICYDILHPPTLILTKLWTADSLFSPSLKKYLSKDIYQLEGCGFVLFKHREYLKRTASSQYREFLVFRYFGDVICPLVVNHNWGKNKSICQSRYCI